MHGHVVQLPCSFLFYIFRDQKKLELDEKEEKALVEYLHPTTSRHFYLVFLESPPQKYEGKSWIFSPKGKSIPHPFSGYPKD